MTARRVGIVGAGIGGLTAAITLRSAGIEVVVHERSSSLGEVGAGVQLSPNATRVLFGLGLEDALGAVAVRPLTGDLRRWENGRTITSQPLGDRVHDEFGYPYLHAHRADLHRALQRLVPPDQVRLGDACAGIEVDERGATIVGGDGRRHTYDAIIGADGIHSVVRTELFGAEDARFSGSAAWRGLVPAERVADLGLPVASTAHLGPDAHFVHYFLRRGELVNWVGVAPTSSWTEESWTVAGDLADARDDFAGWNDIVRRLVAEADEPIYRWALYDRDPRAVWGEGRVSLLGDAVHPMLPFMAQGAAQAIEDAAVLARCLARVDDTARALRIYEDLRRDRTAKVQLAARGNATMFHLPDGPDQRERDERLGANSGDGATHRNAWLYEYDIEAETANLT